MIEYDNKLFGLLGKDIGYSFSRNYFSKKFKAQNLKHQYVNFDLDDLSNFGELLKQKDISGMNVTIPYKQDVIPFLDKLDLVAETIGAVNTIVFRDGEKIGYNTDHIGFKKTLLQHVKPHQKTDAISQVLIENGDVYHVINSIKCLTAKKEHY